MARLRFARTLWDDANRDHILASGEDHPERTIFEEDVDEVVLSRHIGLWSGYEVRGEARFDLMGTTKFDRLLFVTVAPKPNRVARPVSARDATASEQRLFEDRMRSRKR